MQRDASIFRKNLKGALLVSALCVGLSALAVVPFFFMSESPEPNGRSRLWMPLTHDMILHFDQMKSFYSGLASGEFYPRWEEDTNRGFGAPTTTYYPPGIYYLTSAFYAISGDWLMALLCVHLLMMIGSAAALYLYARQLMSRTSAVVAMIAYIFLPYHLIDQYQRGAMAELLGFVWMPLMLLFGERLLRSQSSNPDISVDRRRHLSRQMLNFAGLAATYGAFLWSHPPTAYQFTIAFTVYMLLLIWRLKAWRSSPVLIAAIVLGLGLSAAYLVPAVIERDLIQREYVTEIWPYHATYVFVHELRYANTHRAFFNLIDFIWIFNSVAILAGATVLLKLERRFIDSTSGLRDRVLAWVAIGCLAGFMMTKASYPIGKLIPGIETGVFTWRMLAITTLVAALIAGACAQGALNWLKQRKESQSNSLVSLTSLAIVGGILFMAIRLLPPIYQAPPFATADEHLNYAMVPRGVTEDPMELPIVPPAELAVGNGQVSIEEWNPEHRALTATLNQPDKLLIRTFMFPGWRAMLDGVQAEVKPGDGIRVELADSEQALIRDEVSGRESPMVNGAPARIIGSERLGDIVIELPAGTHRVELDYVDTTPRRAGSYITFCSGILLLGVVLASVILRFRSLG